MATIDLVLMAAGMGSRYGGLKQLEAFGPGGETLMDYGVFDAKRAGFDRVVFVIRREMEAEFRARVADRYRGFIATELAFQDRDDLPAGFKAPEGREKPWGTGHALLAARKAVGGPFCVCNADDFYGREAYTAMAGFLRGAGPGQGALVGFDLGATLSANGTVSRGVCRVRDGLLAGVDEKLKLRRDGADAVDEASGERFALDAPVSLNFWGFHPSALDGFWADFGDFLKDLKDPLKSEYFLPAAVDRAMRAQQLRVRALAGGKRWFGVTYPEDKALVQAELAALLGGGDYPAKLFG